MNYHKYIEQWGNIRSVTKKTRSDFYLLSDNCWTAIKYSKDYGRGYFWYAIVPNLLKTYNDLNITNHIFCFQDAGSVNIPISILLDYLSTADKSFHPDGNYHYHVRFRLDENINSCFLWTGSNQTNISNYLRLFIGSIDNIVKNDLESLIDEENYLEGKKNKRYISFFERNPNLRSRAIEFHGLSCKACGFSFKASYGEHGANYIEVHHLRPVSSLTSEQNINPKTDLTVVCSNCHRMIHRKKDHILTIDACKELITKNKIAR